MKDLWNKVILIGADTNLNRNQIRDVRLVNVVNTVFMAIFFVIGIIDLSIYSFEHKPFTFSTINTTIITLLCVLNVVFISRGLLDIVKIIIILVFPVLLFILPIINGKVINEYFFWYPYIPTAFGIIPHILLHKKKERFYLLLSLSLYLLFTAFSSQLLIAVSTESLAVVPIVKENILFYNVSSIAMFLFMNVTIFYFVNENDKFENWLSLANLEMENQREELKAKNDELVEQRTELSSKNIELENLINQLKTTQSQLIQSEKMASLGTLTSGVAHEINNPLNFISATLQKLESLFEELKEPSISENNRILIINRCIKTLPGGSLGVERIARIVKSLMSFSENSENTEYDIHKIIDSTLLVIGFNIPQEIQVVKDYKDKLPLLYIQQDKLHQIILAIIDNAVNAIQSKQQLEHNKIIITTYIKEENNTLCISIANTGPQIPDDEFSKLFDPFYTSQKTGKGIGLGLTVSYNNITALNGTIIAQNKDNNLVEFIIELPLNN